MSSTVVERGHSALIPNRGNFEIEHPLAPNLRAIGLAVPNLGRGGCGHLALAVHERLSGSEIWIVSSIDLDVNDPDWSKHRYGPVAHATCWHSGFFLDCQGSHRRLCRTGHELTSKRFYRRVRAEMMRSWLEFKFHWNSDFDLAYVPMVRRLVRTLPIPSDRIGSPCMSNRVRQAEASINGAWM